MNFGPFGLQETEHVSHGNRFAQFVAQVLARVWRDAPLSPLSGRRIGGFVGAAFSREQPHRLHLGKVPLEGAPGGFGAQGLESANVDAAVFEHVLDGLGLAGVQAVGVHQNVAANGELAAQLDLGELGGEAFDEELEPAGEVHVIFAHGLTDRGIRVTVPSPWSATAPRVAPAVPVRARPS